MYMNPSSELVIFDPTIVKNGLGSHQLAFVAARDSIKIQGGAEFYLIHIDWLAKWLQFATGETNKFLSKINNTDLIDESNDYKLKSTARFKKQYRVFDKIAWEYLFQRYGGGPVIYFYGIHHFNAFALF